MSDQRRAVAAPGINAWHDGRTTDLSGTDPMVRFTLDDGTEISVDHEGDHLTVRNLGKTRSSGLALICDSGNTIDIRGSQP